MRELRVFPPPVGALGRPHMPVGSGGSVRPDLQGTRSDLPRCAPLLPMRGFPLGQSSDALLRHRHSTLVVLDVRPRLPRPGEPLIERSSDLVCGVPYLGQVVGV